MERDKEKLILDKISYLLARISDLKMEISQLQLRKELILKNNPNEKPKPRNRLQRELAKGAF